MDPNALAGMVFTIILIMIIGGIIIVTPLTRRLGALIELRIREKTQGLPPDELASLRKQVATLEAELRSLQGQQQALEERQEFMESLLQPAEQARSLPAQAGTPSATE